MSALALLVYASTLNRAAEAARISKAIAHAYIEGSGKNCYRPIGEPADKGERLGVGQSHVQIRYIICIYRKSAE